MDDMAMSLRPVGPDDDAFLFELYASTRAADFDAMPMPEDQKAALLRMQFDAQSASYREQYPEGDFNVILIHDQPVGRLYVARSPDEIRLVDISLLPNQRGAGLGTKYVNALVDEGKKAGVPVRLMVASTNRAKGLYQRLGFQAVEDDGVYIEMERVGGAPAARTRESKS